MTIVDDFNRTEIQRNYIDYLIGKMDFMEVKRELWNYINKDKNRYSNYSLELEISRDAPQIIGNLVAGSLHLTEPTVGPEAGLAYSSQSKTKPTAQPPFSSKKKRPSVVAGGGL